MFYHHLISHKINFENFGITGFHWKCNGELHPNEEFKPAFQKGDYLREYQSFIDSIGIQHDNAGNDLNPEEWKSGNCFWALDTSGDMCNNFHTHRSKL